jgi:hypothetical protein
MKKILALMVIVGLAIFSLYGFNSGTDNLNNASCTLARVDFIRCAPIAPTIEKVGYMADVDFSDPQCPYFNVKTDTTQKAASLAIGQKKPGKALNNVIHYRIPGHVLCLLYPDTNNSIANTDLTNYSKDQGAIVFDSDKTTGANALVWFG